MRFTQALKSVRRNWVYLPGITLMLMGITIVLFPETLKWLIAAFFAIMGVALIEAARALRTLARTFRARLADVYLEQPPSEKDNLDLFPPDPSPTWVN